MKKKISTILAIFLFLIQISISNIFVAQEDQLTANIIVENVKALLDHSNTSAVLKINEQDYIFTKDQLVLIIDRYRDSSLDLWYKVKFIVEENEYEAWINYHNLNINDNYQEYLKQQGFPNDYISKIMELHKKYPTWIFEAFNTNIEWKTFIDKEDRKGVSLVDGNNLAYRSVASYSYNPETKKWIPLDGNNWFQANRETISYYADPRNFLNEYRGFMFLSLNFHEYEDANAVQQVLNNTFMADIDNVDKLKYSQIFFDAGKNAKVSPIYLAVLAIQEQGRNGTTCTSGAKFTYNGKDYQGLYNFYNIGASSGADNWKKGLVYANGGADGSATSYLRPWTSPKKAIEGGALFVANGYISKGQDTMYLQRFNVTSYSTFSHQYMTNIAAAYSQGNTMYYTYKNSGNLDTALTFKIPLYKNMPESTSLPTTYTLPEVEPEEPEIYYSGNLINDLNLVNKDGFLSGFKVNTKYKDIKEQVSILKGNVTLKISNSKNEELKDEDLISTGCHFEYTDDAGTSLFTVVIKGDLNGDGEITLADLLVLKKAILQSNTLTNLQEKAVEINGETGASLKTYLAIKKYLLGVSNIEQ